MYGEAAKGLIEKVLDLKKRKKAVILAHYYQRAEIQDVADDIGDSLYLAQQALKINSDRVVLAGVNFMAETAKILNPGKTVLVPDHNAGCSLADSCEPAELKKFMAKHPGHTVVSYINCSAEIKAMSDLVCTSSNAIKMINSIPSDRPIIFLPDKNLGKYLAQETGRNLVLWDGVCSVHEAFSLDKIIELYQKHPEAKLIAHPESDEKLLKVAHFIGSTKALLEYAKADPSKDYIVATEMGILHQARKALPGKRFIPAPINEDNTCACSECPYMKMNTLEKVYLCLKNDSPQVEVDKEIRQKALSPLKRMLELSMN